MAYPLLYHNYLTHPHDVNVLREGTKAAVAYGQTEALKRFGARLHNVPVPKCKHLPLFTDEYWDCYIRQYTLSIYHYSCTAKMGPQTDPWAVVDPQLRVSFKRFKYLSETEDKNCYFLKRNIIHNFFRYMVSQV